VLVGGATAGRNKWQLFLPFPLSPATWNGEARLGKGKRFRNLTNVSKYFLNLSDFQFNMTKW
jgi:hypothetical protein